MIGVAWGYVEYSHSGSEAVSLPFPHRPIDVADVVAFLASEDSGYITGASVEVSGMRPSWGGGTDGTEKHNLYCWNEKVRGPCSPFSRPGTEVGPYPYTSQVTHAPVPMCLPLSGGLFL